MRVPALYLYLCSAVGPTPESMLLTNTNVAPGSSSTSATRSSIAARSWGVLLT